MVPQGIRPVVQLTAVEVIHNLKCCYCELIALTLNHPLCESLYPDSGMGSEEHEILPAGLSVFTQPGGGVRRAEGGVGHHQEHEKEPQLPQLCPLHQSGNVRFTQPTEFVWELREHVPGMENFNTFSLYSPSSSSQRMRCTHLPLC